MTEPVRPSAAEPVNWKASYHQACDDADAYKADAEKRLLKMEQNWRSCQHEIAYLRERLKDTRAAPPAPCQHCGLLPSPGITESVVTNQPGCPVSAVCVLSGCQHMAATPAPTAEPAIIATVDGRCGCASCKERTENIYRMIGACYNCGAKPILMLFRAGDPSASQDCPVCGKYYGVKPQRLATADEIPVAAPPERVSEGKETWRERLRTARLDGMETDFAEEMAHLLDARPAVEPREL